MPDKLAAEALHQMKDSHLLSSLGQLPEDSLQALLQELTKAQTSGVDARDAAALRLIERIDAGKLKPQGKAQTISWSRKSIRRLVSNSFRRHRLPICDVPLDAVGATKDTGREMAVILVAWLQSLGPRAQLVIQRYLDGMSYDDLAKTHRCAQSTIQRRLKMQVLALRKQKSAFIAFAAAQSCETALDFPSSSDD
ncbi:MAG: sigma-70 family RNA polymerase sigma factor [Planctomycetota bacterium]